MRWEDYLVAVIDDLECQAEGLYLAEREGTVADLSLAGYADVDLAARFHGALGVVVRLALPDGLEVRGRVRRAGRGWLLADGVTGTVVVLTRHLRAAFGLPDRGVAEAARPLGTGLSVGTALRALVEDGRPCVLGLVDGRRLDGVPARVGADFLVVRVGNDEAVVPFSALVIVQESR